VVLALGSTAITTAIIGGVLSFYHDEIPPFIAGLGTAAVAVLGTLATQHTGNGNGGRNGNGGNGAPPPTGR
jgi:hypothetical protein